MTTRPPDEGVPDLLGPGLELLFVGFNPSPRSAESGHHYAGPGNQFWRLLFAAGLVPRPLAPADGGELPALGVGSTNLVARPTRGADDLTRAELRAGTPRLAALVDRYGPRVVAYTGKGVYLAASGRSRASWGPQEASLFGARDVVLPSPSGRVRMTFEEKLPHYRRLARLLEAERS